MGSIEPISCGMVNCYLLKTANGSILVDSGTPAHEKSLPQRLQASGYLPDGIRLLVLTHGHSDHIGAATELRERFGVRIAMHPDDVAIVNGKAKSPLRGTTSFSKVLKKISGSLMDRVSWRLFEPDILLSDGQDLAEYGFPARVLHMPGHTAGSIGLLTDHGDFVAGDVFANFLRPGLGMFAEDVAQMRRGIDSLRRYNIRTVYPGHGRPFQAERYFQR